MNRHRNERVASLVRDIVCDAIAHRLNDPRIEPLTTVTRVEVTRDLLIADVYLTVPGKESAEHRTIIAIQHAAGYVQRLVARELSLRMCPQVRFRIDEAAKGVQRTMRILAENRRRHPEVFQTEGEGGDGHSNETTLSGPNSTAENDGLEGAEP